MWGSYAISLWVSKALSGSSCSTDVRGRLTQSFLSFFHQLSASILDFIVFMSGRQTANAAYKLLKTHLLQALYAHQLELQVDPSNIAMLEGVLQESRDNLVLVYAGSFNPPHRGHLDMLLSGLREEIGAVAVVVVPNEDYYVRSKVTEAYPFFLPQRRRADLWNAVSVVPKTKVLVWSAAWRPFELVTQSVVNSTQEAGFSVTFCHIAGPDNLNREDPLSIGPCYLPALLVSDRARMDASHFDCSGRPLPWTGFEQWRIGKWWSLFANGILLIHLLNLLIRLLK